MPELVEDTQKTWASVTQVSNEVNPNDM